MERLVLGSAAEAFPVAVYASDRAASNAVAKESASLIQDRANQGPIAKPGLANDSTPLAAYEMLARLNEYGALSFPTSLRSNSYPRPFASLTARARSRNG